MIEKIKTFSWGMTEVVKTFDCWNNLKPNWIFHIRLTDLYCLNSVIDALAILEFQKTESINHKTKFVLVNSGQMRVYCDGFENPALKTITDKEFLELNEKFIFNAFHRVRQDKLKSILE